MKTLKTCLVILCLMPFQAGGSPRFSGANFFMEEEIWKPVIGFEGFYEVSEYGNIKSLPRTVGSRERSTGVNTRNTSEKLLVFDPNKQGYFRVTLSKKGVNKRFAVHRIVASNFLQNPENKPAVNHKDGNKQNNHYSNLEWVTNSENEFHSYRVLGKINPRKKYV